MSPNAWKWAGTIALGLLGGVVSYFHENPQHFTSWYDLAGHMVGGLAIAIPALKMTLTTLQK